MNPQTLCSLAFFLALTSSFKRVCIVYTEWRGQNATKGEGSEGEIIPVLSLQHQRSLLLRMTSINVNQTLACNYQLNINQANWEQDWNCTFTTCAEVARKCGPEPSNITTVDPNLYPYQLNEFNNHSLEIYCFYSPTPEDGSQCARNLYPESNVQFGFSRTLQEQYNQAHQTKDHDGVGKGKISALLLLTGLGVGLALNVL